MEQYIDLDLPEEELNHRNKNNFIDNVLAKIIDDDETHIYYLRQFIKTTDVNMQDPESGLYPLEFAILGNMENTVSCLMDNGARPDYVSDTGTNRGLNMVEIADKYGNDIISNTLRNWYN